MADLDLVVAKLRAIFELDSAQWESGIRKVQDSAKVWAKDLDKIGQQATDVGKVFTAAFTVPIVAAFGASAKAAIDFESSFAGVRKTVEASEEEFAAMAQAMRDLSKEIPVNVNELNRLGEAAGALGIPKEEIVDFARVMAELGVTTNLTSDQAAEAIAKIQNQFQAAGKETENFASALVALGNAGASTESEILMMATRISAAGQAIGLTQADVLGFAEALASLGLEAEAGGTAISRVFVNIAAAVSDGGTELTNFAEVARMTSGEFASLFRDDSREAVLRFVEGLGQVKTEGGDVLATLAALGIEEVRLRDALLRLAQAGGTVRESLERSNEAWRENNALSEEARKRFETTESQLTLLWNRVKDVAITFGNALLPAIKSAISLVDDFLPVIDSMAKSFAALPGHIQLMVIGFAGLVAAIGPALIVFGQIAMGLSSIITFAASPMLASAGASVLSLVKAFTSLEGIVALASRALALIPGWGWAVLGVSALLTLTKSWDDLWAAVKKTAGVLGEAISLTRDLGTIALDSAIHIATGGRSISEWDANNDRFWRNIRQNVIPAIKDNFDQLKESPGILEHFFEAAKTYAGWLDTIIEKLGGLRLAIKDLAGDIRGDGELPALPQNPLLPTSDLIGPALPAEFRDMSREATEALAAYEKGIAAVKSEHTAAAQATEEHRKKIQAIYERLTGAGAIDAAMQWMQAVQRYGGVAKLAAEDQQQYNEVLGKAIEVYERTGRDVPAWMHAAFEATSKWRQELLQLEQPIKGLPAELDQLGGAINDAELKILDAAISSGKLHEELVKLEQMASGPVPESMRGLGGAINDIEIDNLNDRIKESEERARQYKDAIDGIIGSFSELGSVIGGVAGGIISDLGGFAAKLLEVSGASVETVKAINDAMTVVAGFGQAWQAAGAGGAAGIAGGAIAGAQAGSIGGLYGMAAGAAIGASMGWFQNMAGPTKEEVEQAKQLVEEFRDSIVGAFEHAGTASSQYEMTFKRLKPIYDDLGLSANTLRTHLGDLNSNSLAGVQAAVDQIQDIIEEHKRITEDWINGVATFIDGFTLRVKGFEMSLGGVRDLQEDLASVQDVNNREMEELETHIKELSVSGVEATDELNEARKRLHQLWMEASKDEQNAARLMGEALVPVQEEFDRLTQFAVTSFSTVFSQTGSVVQALDTIREPLGTLISLEDEFGLKGTAAYERLKDIDGVVQANKDLFTSIDGLNLMMRGLDEATLLTKEDMVLFGQDAVGLFDELVSRMIDQGVPATKAMDEAMILMQPTLQTLWEHQQKFGTKIDEATEKLINQAVEAGYVGDDHKDIQTRILEAIELVEDAILRLPAAFLEATEGAKGFREEIEAISRTQLQGPPSGTAQPRTQHEGGVVTAHSGRYIGPFLRKLVGDEVPVIAQVGEAFLNKRATAMLGGPSGIGMLNAGLRDPWAGIGMLSSSVPSGGSLQTGSTGDNTTVNITINVDAPGGDPALVYDAAKQGAMAVLDQIERGGDVMQKARRVFAHVRP